MDILEKTPLKNNIKEKYTDFIHVDSVYYFLMPSERKVVEYNKTIKIHNVEEKYTHITNNADNNTFFVVKEGDFTNIYVIDLCFNEIDSITLNIPDHYKKEISSIYYCIERKRLYITNSYYVFSVTKDGYFVKEEFCLRDIGTVITNHIKKRIDGFCSREKMETVLPNSYLVSCYIDNKYIYIGCIKNNQSYLIKKIMDADEYEELFISDNDKIISLSEIYGRIDFLVLRNCSYYYVYSTNLGIDDRRKYKKNILNKNNAVKSISIIQNALTGILNAEANKINNISNVDGVLEHHKSTNRTINKIIDIENFLNEKLENVFMSDEFE